MADRTWIFELDGMQHTVRLKHNQLTGKVRIWADEQLVKSAHHWRSTNRPYPFQIKGHDCAVVIIPRGFKYLYDLFVDNLPVPSNADLAHGKARQQWAASMPDFQWQELGRQLGLQYWVDLGVLYACRHRLIGTIDGYLCSLHLGVVSETNMRRTVQVDIHHETIAIANVPAWAAKLVADSELQQFLNAKTKPRAGIETTGRCTRFILSCQPDKTPMSTIADQVRTVVRIVARYAKPTPEDLCDECGQHKPLQIALVNSRPLRVCASDLEKLGHLGEASKQRYAHAPSQLGRGILAGIGGMLVASLIWALVFVFLENLTPIVPFFSFMIIIWAVYRAGTKRTIWALLLVAVLTMISGLLGSYLGLVGYAAWHNGTPLTLEALGRITQQFFNGRLIRESLAYGGVALLFWFPLAWAEQASLFRYLFRPRIEVLKAP